MFLIENDLFFVGVPKTATYSVEAAIVESGLSFKRCGEDIYKTARKYDNDNLHIHMTLSEMIDRFGYKESFCIERDIIERWLSGFKHIILNFESETKLTIPVEEISNDLIYNVFTLENVNKLYSGSHEELAYLASFFIEDPEQAINPGVLKVLCSSRYWKGGRKCSYEFDINNLQSLEKFMSLRFGIKFSIPRLNFIEQTKKDRFVNLVVDNKLKDFIYERFEYPFRKTVL